MLNSKKAFWNWLYSSLWPRMICTATKSSAKSLKIIEVNEGTIYPLLKRLTNEKYFETYLRESSEGPPRKYYHLTKSGTLYKDELKEEWLNFNESVTKFIMECDSHD